MSSRRLASGLQTMRIIWGALIASTVTTLVVLRVQPHDDNQLDQMSLIMLLAFGVGSAVAAIALPSYFLTMGLRARARALIQGPEPLPGEMAEPPPLDSDEALGRTLPLFQTPFIMGMALAEAVSLIGFAIGFLGGSPKLFLPFYAVCWVLQLSRFPTRAWMAKALKEADRTARQGAMR